MTDNRITREMRATLALAIAKSGGATHLARELKITTGAVSRWDICPIARVLDVERISGIPRTELRPDYYPTTR